MHYFVQRPPCLAEKSEKKTCVCVCLIADVSFILLPRFLFCFVRAFSLICSDSKFASTRGTPRPYPCAAFYSWPFVCLFVCFRNEPAFFLAVLSVIIGNDIRWAMTYSGQRRLLPTFQTGFFLGGAHSGNSPNACRHPFIILPHWVPYLRAQLCLALRHPSATS